MSGLAGPLIRGAGRPEAREAPVLCFNWRRRGGARSRGEPGPFCSAQAFDGTGPPHGGERSLPAGSNPRNSWSDISLNKSGPSVPWSGRCTYLPTSTALAALSGPGPTLILSPRGRHGLVFHTTGHGCQHAARGGRWYPNVPLWAPTSAAPPAGTHSLQLGPDGARCWVPPGACRPWDRLRAAAWGSAPSRAHVAVPLTAALFPSQTTVVRSPVRSRWCSGSSPPLTC